MDDMKKPLPNCSICGLQYAGFGNNARPVNDGRCCDDCNTMHVIPARLALLFGREKKQEAE